MSESFSTKIRSATFSPRLDDSYRLLLKVGSSIPSLCHKMWLLPNSAGDLELVQVRLNVVPMQGVTVVFTFNGMPLSSITREWKMVHTVQVKDSKNL